MKLRVLVVDDDLALCRVFASALEATQDMSAVGIAGTLAEGRFLLRQSQPDVLLVDLGLPDGDGTALIRESASTLPACDVVVITVFGDEAHVLAAIAAGATGYLLKDADAEELVDQVRVLRSGGSPISPIIARRLLSHLTKPTVQVETLPDDPIGGLSNQEHKVLSMSAKGYTYEETAALLGVSRQTVQTYVKRIYRKLQVHTKTEAVFEARRIGWLSH